MFVMRMKLARLEQSVLDPAELAQREQLNLGGAEGQSQEVNYKTAIVRRHEQKERRGKGLKEKGLKAKGLKAKGQREEEEEKRR